MPSPSFTLRLQYEDDLYVVVVKAGVVLNYQWFYGHECFGKYSKLTDLPPTAQKDIRKQLDNYNIPT